MDLLLRMGLFKVLLLPFDFFDVFDFDDNVGEAVRVGGLIGEDGAFRGVIVIDLDEIVFVGLFYRAPGPLFFGFFASSRAFMA